MFKIQGVESVWLVADEEYNVKLTILPNGGEQLILALGEVHIVRSALCARMLLDFGKGASPQYVLAWDELSLPGELEGGGIVTPDGI